MLIPKAALIATGEDGQEAYDGTVQYVEVDAENVEIDSVDLATRVGEGEDNEAWEPNFNAGDVEWEIEDDD